jgi:hypothetical protein
VKIPLGRVTLNIEPPQEELPDTSIPAPEERFPPVIKTYIDTTPYMIETNLFWQFDIEKKYFLKGFHSHHVSRVNGDLPSSLLTERPAGKLVRRGWHLAIDLRRQGLSNLLWKPNLHPQSPFPNKVNVGLRNDNTGCNR